jgi:ATP-dependent protease ClpP protease subunit
LQDAKGVIEKALSIGAITVVDAAVQPRLRELLAEINAPQERVPAGRNENATQSPPLARVGSAKVTGNVPCNGTAVGLSIDIDGEIDARTVESVSKLFDEYHERETKVKSEPCDYNPTRLSAYGVHYGINSRGGNVAAAMAIGRMFRKENAWLGVKGVCISACVLILAGAVDRQIGGSDVVGIHRPYFGTTPQRAVTADQVKSAYRAMLQDIRAYLREMNVAERLADDMLAVEPERVRVLTQAELKGYGLAGLDPAEQQRRAIENEARDVREAAQLGLDRAEYTRRKALGESVCAYTSAGEPVADYPEFWKCKQRVLKTGQR